MVIADLEVDGCRVVIGIRDHDARIHGPVGAYFCVDSRGRYRRRIRHDRFAYKNAGVSISKENHAGWAFRATTGLNPHISRYECLGVWHVKGLRSEVRDVERN